MEKNLLSRRKFLNKTALIGAAGIIGSQVLASCTTNKKAVDYKFPPLLDKAPDGIVATGVAKPFQLVKDPGGFEIILAEPIPYDLMIGRQDGLMPLSLAVRRWLFLGDVTLDRVAVNVQLLRYPAHAEPLSMQCQNVHEHLHCYHGKLPPWGSAYQ